MCKREIDGIKNPISKMAAKLEGMDGGLHGFYRSVYKGTPCGPSIGFLLRIDDEIVWRYNDDLPNYIPDDIEGVSVSSIVEGSDVEVSGYKQYLKDFDEDKFWKEVDDVNDEAEFYWDRDNKDGYIIKRYDKMEGYLLVSTFGDIEWEESGNIDQDEKEKIEKAINAVELLEGSYRIPETDIVVEFDESRAYMTF